MAEQNRETDRPTSGHPFWAWLVPLAVLGLLGLTYVLFPDFYVEYVLSKRKREHQAVEILTFITAFLSGLLLTWSAGRLWKRGGPLGARGDAFIVGVIAAASLFFAGEEISWGQSYLGWETPETVREVVDSGETNLHNSFIPVNTMGTVFLVAMFFMLPFVWHAKWPITLPASWSRAIPEGPVVFSMAIAYSWRLAKQLYQVTYDDYTERQAYIGFIEQINEHKELLVAVSLLMYGVYRVRAVRPGRIDASGSATDSAAVSAG